MSPWEEHRWIELSQYILNSHALLVGTELIGRVGTPLEQAKQLFEAPFVVVAHGAQDNPILCYANETALALWKISIPVLLRTPSRETAEPVHREERARLLERTTRDGFVDDYRGIRIATDGQRFLIHRATVWNLVDADGQHVGQAATFRDWQLLGKDEVVQV